jgi:hypothetical protein
VTTDGSELRGSVLLLLPARLAHSSALPASTTHPGQSSSPCYTNVYHAGQFQLALQRSVTSGPECGLHRMDSVWAAATAERETRHSVLTCYAALTSTKQNIMLLCDAIVIGRRCTCCRVALRPGNVAQARPRARRLAPPTRHNPQHEEPLGWTRPI